MFYRKYLQIKRMVFKVKKIAFFLVILLLNITGFSCTNKPISQKVCTLSELTLPEEYMYADKEQLFLIDSNGDPDERKTHIYVYSLKDYSLLFTFGGVGEQPGKFLIQKGHNVNLSVRPDLLSVSSTGKVSTFKRDGTLVGEIAIPQGDHFGFQPFGRGHVGTESYKENDKYYYHVMLYDSVLNVTKKLSRHENARIAFYTGFFYDVRGDRLYVVGRTRDFDIDVYDIEGELIQTIHHDYERVSVTADQMEALLDIYRTNPAWAPYFEEIKKSLKYPERHQAIQRLYVDNEHIYVITRNQVEGRRDIWVLDLDGSLKRKTMVPFSMKTAFMWNPCVFRNGRLYQLIQDQETQKWELFETNIL